MSDGEKVKDGFVGMMEESKGRVCAVRLSADNILKMKCGKDKKDTNYLQYVNVQTQKCSEWKSRLTQLKNDKCKCKKIKKEGLKHDKYVLECTHHEGAQCMHHDRKCPFPIYNRRTCV